MEPVTRRCVWLVKLRAALMSLLGKVGGNYAPTIPPQVEVSKKGYAQVKKFCFAFDFSLI